MLVIVDRHHGRGQLARSIHIRAVEMHAAIIVFIEKQDVEVRWQGGIHILVKPDLHRAHFLTSVIFCPLFWFTQGHVSLPHVRMDTAEILLGILDPLVYFVLVGISWSAGNGIS